jgi:hypothetical protein
LTTYFPSSKRITELAQREEAYAAEFAKAFAATDEFPKPKMTYQELVDASRSQAEATRQALLNRRRV